jgi:hypothetical protein
VNKYERKYSITTQNIGAMNNDGRFVLFMVMEKRRAKKPV